MWTFPIWHPFSLFFSSHITLPFPPVHYRHKTLAPGYSQLIRRVSDSHCVTCSKWGIVTGTLIAAEERWNKYHSRIIYWCGSLYRFWCLYEVAWFSERMNANSFHQLQWEPLVFSTFEKSHQSFRCINMNWRAWVTAFNFGNFGLCSCSAPPVQLCVLSSVILVIQMNYTTVTQSFPVNGIWWQRFFF